MRREDENCLTRIRQRLLDAAVEDDRSLSDRRKKILVTETSGEQESTWPITPREGLIPPDDSGNLVHVSVTYMYM